MSVTASETSPRRAATRERVLDGAHEVFVERGFGRATPEQICERAGFTRGAFYSNFSSMDEVFLALWKRQAGALVDRVRAAADSVNGDRTDASFQDAVTEGLRGLVADPSWHVLMVEFVAHATRHPELSRVVAEYRASLRDALAPIIVDVLAAFGRELNADRDLVVRAVVAGYDGAMSQAMTEPDDPVPQALGLELVARIIWSFSRETT